MPLAFRVVPCIETSHEITSFSLFSDLMVILGFSNGCISKYFLKNSEFIQSFVFPGKKKVTQIISTGDKDYLYAVSDNSLYGFPQGNLTHPRTIGNFYSSGVSSLVGLSHGFAISSKKKVSFYDQNQQCVSEFLVKGDVLIMQVVSNDRIIIATHRAYYYLSGNDGHLMEFCLVDSHPVMAGISPSQEILVLGQETLGIFFTFPVDSLEILPSNRSTLELGNVEMLSVSGPYLVTVGKNLSGNIEILSLMDGSVIQELSLPSNISQIYAGETGILLTSGKFLFNLSQVSTEDQLDAMVDDFQIEAAFNFVRKIASETECEGLFARIRDRAGWKFLDLNQLEPALEYLEKIPNFNINRFLAAITAGNFESSPRLYDFLLKRRTVSNPKMDNLLFDMASELGDKDLMDKLLNLKSVQVDLGKIPGDDEASILIKGKILYSQGSVNEGIALMANFLTNLEILIFAMKLLGQTDYQTFKGFIPKIIQSVSEAKEDAVLIKELFKVLDRMRSLEETIEILVGFPKLYETWLLEKSKENSQLTGPLIKFLLECGQNDSLVKLFESHFFDGFVIPTDLVESYLSSCEAISAKLRYFLLLKSNTETAPPHVILETALQVSTDFAISHCETHPSEKTWLLLLAVLIDSRRIPKAIELASLYIDRISPSHVLHMLPAGFELSLEISDYLQKCAVYLTGEESEAVLNEAVVCQRYLQVYCEWQKIRAKTAVTVHNKTSYCPVCQAIIGDRAFVAFPNGTVTHVQCAGTDLTVDPITGDKFNISIYS
jgi:Vacuolar sorting protein 39 domain 2